MPFIGKVISRYDEYDGGRIKVRLKNQDAQLPDSELPLAWPLLPKMFHVRPKENESVFIFCANDDPAQQRYYIGPIISQNQRMYKDKQDVSALTLLNGIGVSPLPAVSNEPKTFGAFGTDDDIIIYGRKNSDIILSDSDVRIRCGARLTDSSDTTKIGFNKNNPSVIKLKYHESPVSVTKPLWNKSQGEMSDHEDKTVESSINLIGQEINIISTNGDPYVNTSYTKIPQSGDETISDEDIKKFIESAHPLPYGDVLLRFLHVFVKAFKNHTHKYHQLPPVPDSTFLALEKFPTDTILSKNVRIN